MNLGKPDRCLAQLAPTPEYFDGIVHMQPLVSAATSQELELVAVFFDAGARTIPHTHSTDQVLWVVEGQCVVADETGRRILGPGECAFLPAERWHWHGAAPGGPACHVSIRRPGPTNWDVARRDW